MGSLVPRASFPVAMSHPLTLLAHHGACQVEHCHDCDVLHVTIGPVTLRVQPAAAQQLRRALTTALARLDASPTLTTSSSGPVLAN